MRRGAQGPADEEAFATVDVFTSKEEAYDRFRAAVPRPRSAMNTFNQGGSGVFGTGDLRPACCVLIRIILQHCRIAAQSHTSSIYAILYGWPLRRTNEAVTAPKAVGRGFKQPGLANDWSH